MTPLRLRSYSVRRARPDEVAALCELRLASLVVLEMPRQQLATVETLRRSLPDIDRDLLEDGRYFVADLHGELIGGAGWSPVAEDWRAEELFDEHGERVSQVLSEDAVVLRGFFLDPDLGRRAVGANLLAHVEADAAKAGHVAAELLAPEAAQVMYRSLGYRPVRPLWLRSDADCALRVLHMRRPLPVRLTAAA
jgi:GNAT superfamily N-acetyltransferase